MKNSKKIMGIATAVATALSLCGGQMSSKVQPLIAEAESYSEKIAYGDYLTVRKVDDDYDEIYDYIEVCGCDESAVEVEIPFEIDGLPVSSIGDYAFYGCNQLISITMPDSINSTILRSFYNSGIKKLIIADGSQTVTEKMTYGLESYIEEVVIPDSVTSIGENAFQYCSELAEITIPDSVTSIGKGAFSGTAWLEAKQAENPLVIVNNILVTGGTCSGEVVIPDSVTTIGIEAFALSKITGVTIPDSVISIEDYAFAYNDYLKNVTIGNGVKNIKDYAFYNCGVKSIVIPDSVTSIGNYAFSRCYGLTSVIIGKGLADIGEYAFLESSAITSITIPDNVTSIGKSAFESCRGLESIIIVNPECDIYKSRYTVYNETTIYGYINSTAQAYAEDQGRNFVALDGLELTTPAVTTSVTTTTTTATQTTVSETTETTSVTETTTTTATAPSEIPVGDANGDNVLNARDCATIAYALANGTVDTLPESADFNGDGKIDVRDAAAVANYLANK